MAKPDPAARASERVSLHGVSPEEALRALLAVNPDDDPVDVDQGDDEAPAD